MRLVITGGTGFIGGHLLRSLAREHEVVCLARRAGAFDGLRDVSVVEVDFAAKLPRQLLPEQADAIIHLAQANVTFPAAADELFSVNIAATQALASYARTAGVRKFIYASSGNVYTPKADLAPFKESDPTGASNYYTLTKLTSESILETYEPYFDVARLRLFAPYGPGQVNRMIPRIVELVKDGREVVLRNGGEPHINPIYIEDVVRIFVRAVVIPGSHTVNIGGPKVVSVRDIALVASSHFGVEPKFAVEEHPMRTRLVADIGLSQRLFEVGDLVDPVAGIGELIASGARIRSRSPVR